MTQQVIETQQNTTAPIETGTVHDDVSDADLIAAAQEAGGAASVDVDAEAAAAGQPPPVRPDATAGEPAIDPAEPKIAAVMRAREEAFKKREEAQDYAAQLRQRAEQEAEQIRANARKQAAADYEADLQARRAKFREAPAAAIRELGFRTEDMVDAVTREGTAEWKAIRAAEDRAAAAEAKAGAVDQVKADFEAFKNAAAQREQQAQVAAVEQQFLAVHATPEKAPYLHKRYDEQEIIQKAHAQANAWTKAGIPFAHGDVAEYLEHQARQRLAGVPVPPQQVSGGGSAQKVRATGSRTLSAAGGSERRASPKPIEEMSPEEERAALIEAAAEARRTSGG